MRFFEDILTVVASSQLKVRYPLNKAADQSLAQILLGTWAAERLSGVLAAECSRDYGDDDLSAVRERAAGAALSSLVDLPMAPWLDFLRAMSDRLDGGLRIHRQHQAMALDLLLSAAVLSGDSKWVSRVLQARYKIAPQSAECAWATPLFAEADALVSGSKHDFPDLVPFAARAIPGNGAIYLALAIAHHGPRIALEVLHGASAALDADLDGPDGKLRVQPVGELQWRRVRAADRAIVELRACVQGTGGPVHAVPWALPLDMLGPWHELDELYRSNVVVNNADGTKASQRAIAALLRDPDVAIRLTVKCEGDFKLETRGVAAIRDRLPAGVRWLRELHPSFRAQVSFGGRPVRGKFVSSIWEDRSGACDTPSLPRARARGCHCCAMPYCTTGDLGRSGSIVIGWVSASAGGRVARHRCRHHRHRRRPGDRAQVLRAYVWSTGRDANRCSQ